MERPSELLKPFANRVAQVAFSEDGVRAIRFLRVLGLLGPPDHEESDSSITPESFDRVGIWERSEENGEPCFVRSMDMVKDWPFWANAKKIGRKKAKQRVVLIGESVARGYLYDPQFTPAMALEEILKSQLGEGEVEVIDLARTNLCFEVKELAISALLLDPDLVIIFSGNNWGASFPLETFEIAYIDAVLREKGVAGLKQFAEKRLVKKTKEVVKDIASVYESRKVPLVWIIPEFNLGDWREPITNAPHLSSGLNREWITCLGEAQSALRDKELDRASELAKKVVEIDQGVTAAALYILAECCQQANDLEGARRYLQQARDAMIWDLSRHILPRTYSVTQEAMRDEITRHENEIVNMPEVLKEYLNGGIPDRRMFLDYCHLTTEGIQVVMAAAASCVLRSLRRIDIPWKTLVDMRIAPSREVEAEAAFLAAIHNAHYWQSYELVRYYCSRSVKLAPHVVRLMTCFIDFQTRRTVPMLMCKSAEEIADMGSPLMKHYLFHNNSQQLDRLLLDAIVAALEEVGIDARKQLDQLRRDEHSVTREDTDLLAYYYCSAALQPQEVAWVIPIRGLARKANNFYKAYWHESRFVFVGEAGSSVRLQLTCRLPDSGLSEGSITVEVNRKSQAEIVIGRQWGTWDITIAGEFVREGLNEVAIRWPFPEFPSSDSLEAVMEDLIDKKVPEFFCVFGEIHSFIASDGRKVATDLPLAQQEPDAVEAEVSLVSSY